MYELHEFFLFCYGNLQHLHSFPTRRSSDLPFFDPTLNTGFTTAVSQGGSVSFGDPRSEEHTSELQSHSDLVCRLLLEKKNALLRPLPFPVSRFVLFSALASVAGGPYVGDGA